MTESEKETTLAYCDYLNDLSYEIGIVAHNIRQMEYRLRRKASMVYWWKTEGYYKESCGFKKSKFKLFVWE